MQKKKENRRTRVNKKEAAALIYIANDQVQKCFENQFYSSLLKRKKNLVFKSCSHSRKCIHANHTKVCGLYNMCVEFFLSLSFKCRHIRVGGIHTDDDSVNLLM